MPDLYELLRNFGFPAFVAAFLLWRVDKRLHRIAEILTTMTSQLAILINRRDPPQGGVPT